ncbi:MAG TPA: sugar ABC transporter permease, partial [Chloroflexota bacterium]|nr:sugar ABC transporter permease [Chloroflexota bacterium]
MATPAASAGEAAAAEAQAAPTAGAPVPRGRRRTLAPYLLLAPTVIFLALFFAWPMIQSLVLAFQDSGGE